MFSFQFTLQALLAVKTNEKNEMMQQFSQVQYDLEKQKRILYDLTREKIELHKVFHDKKSDGGIIVEWNQYSQFLHELSSKILSQTQAIKLAEKKYQEVEKLLIAILRDIKVLEKLREKQLLEYNMMLEKENEKQMDTLVAYKTAAGGGQYAHKPITKE